MSGPAPFVYRLGCHEAVPDSAKDALGGMTVTEICALGVVIVAAGFAATLMVNALLEKLNAREPSL